MTDTNTEYKFELSADNDDCGLVFEALGAASMCWENPRGAGVFDVERATTIAEELCRRLGIDTSSLPEGVS